MRNLLLAAALGTALLLGGCQENDLLQIQTEYKIVIAPDSLYKCPRITKWPAIKTLTDLQVAKTLVNLAEANKICAASLDAVHKFYNDAKVRVESKNPKKKQK